MNEMKSHTGNNTNTDTGDYRDYGWQTAEPTHMHRLFMPAVIGLIDRPDKAKPPRVLDVGCGNGYSCGVLQRQGFEVTGIDLSESGIRVARQSIPSVRFELLAANEHLLENLQCKPFDIIISTEVVEHLYAPRSYVRGCFQALVPGGQFICTTPYHGYLKNLGLALCGAWDRHANPLWDGGHIKLWSRATLSKLLTEAGFKNLEFRGVGRLPFLWMTMVMRGFRPSS